MNPETRWEHIVEKYDMPARIQALPYDKRGLPIPHIVYRNPNTGEPSFVVNDRATVVEDCYGKGLCAICGRFMTHPDHWQIGGPGSAYDPRGMYIDTAVHHECGTFALKVCPYLGKTFEGVKDGLSKDRYLSRIPDDDALILTDPTMDPNKPKIFVFAQMTGFKILADPSTESIHLIPNRPWGAIEHWKDGKKIADVDAETQQHYRDLYQAEFFEEGTYTSLSDLPQYMQDANTNQYEGLFTWV